MADIAWRELSKLRVVAGDQDRQYLQKTAAETCGLDRQKLRG
jgi:hypothetical protein